jgi:hypothetical protein
MCDAISAFLPLHRPKPFGHYKPLLGHVRSWTSLAAKSPKRRSAAPGDNDTGSVWPDTICIDLEAAWHSMHIGSCQISSQSARMTMPKPSKAGKAKEALLRQTITQQRGNVPAT